MKLAAWIVLALVVSACGPSTQGTTSTTPVSTSTTLTTVSSTTTTVPATTTTIATGWSPPEICDCPDEIAATVPVGDDGVTYRNVGVEEAEPNGPGALEIEEDGTFVLLDTPGQAIVLASAENIERVPLHWEGLQALIDAQPTTSGFVVLDLPFGNNQPRLIDLDSDGGVNQVLGLPDGLWLEDGLTGIGLAPNGDIWVELEFGISVAQRDLPTDTYQFSDGYPYPNGLYRPLSWFEPTIEFQAGDVTLEIASRLGGTMTSSLIGVNPDNSFVVWAIELTQDEDGVLHTTEQALWYDESGALIATADLPRDDQFVYVPLPVALGPDGYVYYLQTAEEEVHVLRLGWHTPAG
jgi:hypothetical protein